VEIYWKDGEVDKAVIYSKLGGKCRIRSATPIKLVGQEFKTIEPGVIEFDTRVGGTYVITTER